MAPTLWERILLAFQYNDALWHNVFLTILYILAGLSLWMLLRIVVRSIAKPRDIHDTARRRSPLKALLGWFFGSLLVLGFPLGLFLILSVVLSGSGSASIPAGILAYEKDGVPTSVVLVDKFIANSTGEGITTGTSKAYVYAIHAENGTPIWKTGIGRSDSPLLFGQTEDRIVLFDGRGPLVLDKAGGAEVADVGRIEASNTGLHDQFPAEIQRYTWDDEQKILVFQGLDGGLYSLDPDTLEGRALTNAKPADYFGGDPVKTPDVQQRLGLIRSGQADGRYLLFLNEEKADALRDGTYGDSGPAAGTAEDSRRRLYIGSLLNNGVLAAQDLEPLLDSVFLNGGFLNDLSADAGTSSDADPYWMTEFPEYATIEQKPQMPKLPDPVNWPSEMTIDQYESYSAEQTRRMEAYYAARDAYNAANTNYRDQESRYGNAARALLRLNASSGKPPFRYTDKAGGHEILLVLHDAVVAQNTDKRLSAVDPQAGKVLWSADTHLQSLSGYSRSGDYLTFAGRGEGGNSYLFTVSLTDGSGWGYDFKYDRSLKF